MLHRRTPSVLVALLITFGTGYLAYATMGPSENRTFPYSGTLRVGDVDANGTYNFRFALFASEPDDVTTDCLLNSPPNCGLWSAEVPDVDVVAGGFAVELAGVPDSAVRQDALWLAMAVQEKDVDPTFTELAGAQKILPTPWAARAAAAKDYRVAGTLTVTNGADITSGGMTVAGGADITGGMNVTGDVGIGTSNPQTALHVEAGDVRVRSADNDNTPNIAQFYANNLTQGVGIGFDRVAALGSNASQDLHLVPRGAGKVFVDGSLSVTSGLPVTLSGEYSIAQANGGNPISVTMTSVTRSACFLTRMYIHDTMANESVADCDIQSNGSNWLLFVNTDVGSGDPDAECHARCISW